MSGNGWNLDELTWISFLLLADLLAKVAKDRFGALQTEYQKVTRLVVFTVIDFLLSLCWLFSVVLSLFYNVNVSEWRHREQKLLWLAAPPVNPQFSFSFRSCRRFPLSGCFSLSGSDDVHVCVCVCVFVARPLTLCRLFFFFFFFRFLFFHSFLYLLHALSTWSGLLWPPPAREHCADPPGKTLDPRRHHRPPCSHCSVQLTVRRVETRPVSSLSPTVTPVFPP